MDSKIIIALDFSSSAEALSLLDRLDPRSCRVKIGKELFTRYGPRLVEQVQTLGFEVFLDLKFHDIPATVAKACSAAVDLGVWMLNVHALGGRKMLQEARKIVPENGPTRLIAVTILTSMKNEDLPAIGLAGDAQENVQLLAQLTADCGLDGVVCSAQEAPRLREMQGNNFLLVSPGIRPSWAATNDQNRITTPSQAIENGVDYLVIGRPITQAENPEKALMDINESIATL